MTLEEHLRAALGGLLWQTLVAAAELDQVKAELADVKKAQETAPDGGSDNQA